MKSNYLIYPMVLSFNDFNLLKGQISVLSNLNFNRMAELRKCCHNIVYYLAKAILDLQEILTNKNSRGYRYNSYLLNMSILKLIFILELIKAKELPYLSSEYNTIKSSIGILNSILLSASESNDIDTE